MSDWQKAIVELPQDLDEYRVLLEGVYESFQPPPYYPRNYVNIDNLEFRRCSVKGNHYVSILRYYTNQHQLHRRFSVTPVAEKPSEAAWPSGLGRWI